MPNGRSSGPAANAGKANLNGKPSAALRVVELFAGIGLVRLAVESRRWRVVFANDFDEQKAAMYRANFAGDELHTGDVHAVRADEIPDCDLLTASFPCNDLSIAGAMAGLNGKQSGAFWAVVRLLRELGERRPPVVLLENVVGFLMSRRGRDFEAAMLAMNDLGYSCDAMILNAASFAPQSRQRLFVVAAMLPAEPPGVVTPSGARPQALTDYINEHPRIGWRIRPLPEPPSRTAKLTDVLEDLPDDDPAWWNNERAGYFVNQLSERHSAVAAKMIAGARYSYGTAFRRVRYGRSMAELRTDGIAGCLRTPRGGSGRQILFKAGRGRYMVRLMTARECARLQGVPDSYKIDVPLNQALFGFGDAVCVPVVRWIIDNHLAAAAAEAMGARQH
ncbi:MAG TPA: DNA (cytosine-5-)-methyltransferase [Pirellulales bacterium]|nr:DNA (cytosine-5-)-methyltransferase [Pirellulales bacterium]